MHVGPRIAQRHPHPVLEDEARRDAFLPAAWRTVDRGSRDGAPYRYLWLLSRGPMSHGCTHLNAGHIAELRQMLPADTEKLYEVDLFLNTSYRYDVFDIDGDFDARGDGRALLHRLLAARTTGPIALRVRDERHAYYDWLYGGELGYDCRRPRPLPRRAATAASSAATARRRRRVRTHRPVRGRLRARDDPVLPAASTSPSPASCARSASATPSPGLEPSRMLRC